MPLSPRTLRPFRPTPTFKEDQGYARVWSLTTKSSGDIFGSATTDTGHYAVKWWDNTVEVNPSGDPFSKPAAGGKRAFEVYPVSEQGTSLLLHFDGTNGSTTFTDSSSNGLTATAEGTAEISTAESQFGGASGYFDGGGYLSIAADSALDLSGADFCIELWAYPNALESTAALISQGLPNTIENCWSLEPSGGDIAFFASAGDPGQTIALVLSGSLATGEWSHIAVTCESGTARLFINGALVDSASLSLASTAGTPLIVGAGWYDPATRGADCYIDELRITKGSAIYTAAFTPPASALTSTPLAFAPAGQFNSFDLSDNGLLKVRSEGVTLAAGTAGYTQTGYPYAYVSGDPAESGNVSNNSLSSQALDQFYTDLDAGGGDLFVQGNPGIDGDDPTIATGKGYTVFGSVPPVTSLLLNFNGTNGSTVFTDSSPNELTVTANGDAEISTAQSKYGGSSGYFDGDGDGLSTANNPLFDFAGGDFTVEAWVRPTGAKSVNCIAALRAATDTDLAFAFYVIDNSTHLVLSSNGTTWAVNGGGTESVPDDAWTHVAFVRHGDTVSAYVNGVLSQSHSFTGSIYASTEPMRIGLGAYSGANQDFQGYIDDLRIIKGQALYTGNFTPPTAAFPTGAADPHWDDVSLLLPMDADFDDASSNALTVTANGDAAISTARSVFGGSSLRTNNGYLTTQSTPLPDISGADWTVEAWLYPTGDANAFFINLANAGAAGFSLYYTAGQLHWNDGAVPSGVSGALPQNAWSHVAVCRSSGVVTLYVNGARQSAEANDAAPGPYDVLVGRFADLSSWPCDFYIDELRITKGVARYTSNFTPPTAQLTVYP